MISIGHGSKIIINLQLCQVNFMMLNLRYTYTFPVKYMYLKIFVKYRGYFFVCVQDEILIHRLCLKTVFSRVA
jgi:hypothetical protein